YGIAFADSLFHEYSITEKAEADPVYNSERGPDRPLCACFQVSVLVDAQDVLLSQQAVDNIFCPLPGFFIELGIIDLVFSHIIGACQSAGLYFTKALKDSFIINSILHPIHLSQMRPVLNTLMLLRS